ncbi:YhcB family protein [Gilvimarinus agarilyticus]|uniref:YhcB family protein n=1 Tax=unclassified Gilvimarinus TaxID=2642066 RepID=UPI001C0A4FD0|nr:MULTISPECIES: YhcB family protein [unclassified Gilvimarinus]MBU2887640.1 YhcB family protein [Gilvimarinus agarilyticus]MDO6572291.1 YhcB family protein [Gilvimarinus sp. 2_MG-2023]MDO6746858.1 YhcB family protein [Gilvimarinus sp. 1_MG-2023]
MYSLITLIVTALIATFVGCLVGYLLSRNSNGSNRSSDLQNRLQEAEQALDSYQHDVTDHFARTTELVNSLNASYRDMHEHLASSALKLSTPEIGRQLLDESQHHLPGHKGHDLEHTDVEAPRDWAPKRAGSKGTLSEDYGMEEPAPATGDNLPEDGVTDAHK